MKKIGVITYFHYDNYGTMLQGYALTRAIDDIGGEKARSEIIDYRFQEKSISRKQLLKIRFKRLFVYLFQMKRVARLYRFNNKLQEKVAAFDAFERDYCNTSEITYKFSTELMDNPPMYDTYITGSDQTWSPKIGFNEALFLSFAPNDRVRAAYAPSIGVAYFTEEQRNYVKNHLRSYQFVSCRERYGTEILKDLSPVEVTTVLDPTLLISSDTWNKIATKPSLKKPYILCYFIGDRPYYRDFAKQLSKQKGIPLVYIPVSYQDLNSENQLLWKTGPREFLGLIGNAEVVLTDSFHGTIFSINFNKTFYSFTKHPGIDSMDNLRIVDILDRMALKDRLVLEYKKGKHIPYSEINYNKTNELLSQEREVSTAYLKRIIEVKV